MQHEMKTMFIKHAKKHIPCIAWTAQVCDNISYWYLISIRTRYASSAFLLAVLLWLPYSLSLCLFL